MSYIINNSRGQVVAVVADGTVNTTATSLSLVGRALTDYGTFENENYVFLLENFANPTAPLQPILGQIWYDAANDVLSAYGSGNVWIPLASNDYVQAQKISPVFTGVPVAPTATAGTATTQIATTAFVSNSPQFTGVPTAPTAGVGTSNNQVATTAFVTQSPALTGVPVAPTAPQGTANTQIATTAFVTNSPAFTGNATAVTAANGTSTTQIATTAFVQNLRGNIILTGITSAPTATFGANDSQIATTAFVQSEKNSPGFTGNPTAPTAGLGTSSTQIATTQFVQITTNAMPTMSQQNANSVAITGGTITGISALGINVGGTGANSAANARTNLGLGTMATQNALEVGITGGGMSDVVISGGTIADLASPIAIASGGTGGNTAGTARTSLGLGTIATQNSNNVGITGGNISGLTAPIEVASGGTNATTPDGARNNLGLGTIATQNFSAVGITGGTLTGITNLNASGVTITSGTITGITDLSVNDGGTGASNPTDARANLGAAASATQVIAGTGLSGGGALTTNVTLAIATNSNGYGTRYVSTSAPSGGNNGDIWYQI